MYGKTEKILPLASEPELHNKISFYSVMSAIFQSDKQSELQHLDWTWIGIGTGSPLTLK